MSLDMYLSRELSFYGLSEDKEEVKEICLVTKKGKRKTIKVETTSEKVSLKIEVAYWRKAYAIDKWFIDNCAFGDDEKELIYLNIDDLRKLKELCEQVKQKVEIELIPPDKVFKEETPIVTNPDEIIKLLPLPDSFQFGSAIYDKQYLQNIDYTIKQLDKIISDHEKLIARGIEKYDITYVYEAIW